MAYKKFNLYEGVKISEKLLSIVIVLSLVALAVIIISFANPGGEKEISDPKIRIETDIDHSPAPINMKNTQYLIR